MAENVAIPILNDEIAPCFEVAHCFVIAEIGEGGQLSKSVRECGGCEGYGRVKFLISKKIDLLICNGIKQFYRDLLSVSGISIISDIAGSVEEALKAYLLGSLAPPQCPVAIADPGPEIPHSDLVCWTRELFESNGYSVSQRPGHLPLLIDLVAVITCPLCRKSIRVGICCGAHTYRVSNEIMEFHHAAPNEFQVKVYVYPSNPEVHKTCSEYRIELIDPNSEDDYLFRPLADKIPILRNPIAGHEKACMCLSEDKR